MELDSDETTPRSRRRILGVVAGSALLAAALLGLSLYLLQRTWGVGVIARPFDHAAWVAPDRHPGDRPARRERMVRNLVKRHLHTGMTRAEVEALLGPGDEDSLLALREPGEWIYRLGSTFLGTLRVLTWGLGGSDAGSVDDFESAGEAFEIRALRLGFDEQDRLASIEIQSM